MSTPLQSEPGPRALRPDRGDVRLRSVTSGAAGVISGPRPIGLKRAAPLIALMLAVVCTINVFSHLHDAHAAGVRLPLWEPVIWEATSALTDFPACAIIWLALSFAPPVRGGWGRFAVVQALATIAFSAAHVGGMWALRVGAYAMAGAHYRVPWADGLYEYPKDVLAYVGFGSLLWLAPRIVGRRGAAAERPGALAADALFDIQDGVRLLRVPLSDILAVRAAGNYVEFLLRDERRPLMRAPLARIAAQLGPAGFARTHRSWLVNATAVRAIEPAGSGDYRLALAGGAEAPLSRRFPEALERLKGAGR